MRISAIKGDPGYTDGCYGVRIFLDGVEVDHVFTADEERRFIVQGDLDARGRLQISTDGETVRTVKRYGEVRVELPEGFTVRQAPDGTRFLMRS